MNDQSPPKRLTRARAAAKTTDTGVNTTKIETAASKAKATRSVPTTKRKTRGNDVHKDEEDELNSEIIEPEAAKPRGRPKRAAAPQPQSEPEAEPKERVPATTKTTRSRQGKVPAVAPVTELGRQRKIAIDPAITSEPARSLRGRPKKVEIVEESIIVMDEPPKKTTRSRAATLSKATVPKKTVKFEEPDKENVVPVRSGANGKDMVAEMATGLKAKPVRKAAPTLGRATRGRPKPVEPKLSPLSPKKATQVSAMRDQSDDELATTEKTPMKPLMKSPIKAPGSVFGTAKKLVFSNDITVNRVVTQNYSTSIMSSPARRPPQSPFKDGMKLSPQKVNAGNMLSKSPFKFSVPTQKSVDASSPFKASMLQSPARRPQSPTKVMENGSPTRSGTSTFAVTPKASTFKVSRFTATPRTLINTPSRRDHTLALKSGSVLPTVDLDQSDVYTVNKPEAPELSFSGRLSSIVPREVDSTVPATEVNIEEAKCQFLLESEQTGEAMTTNDTITVNTVELNTNATSSPFGINMAALAFREARDSPFEDSDSEDELASSSLAFSPAPIKRNNVSVTATPTQFAAIAKTPRTSVSSRAARSQQIGFTPLAKQLTDWMAASPEKSDYDSSESDELADMPNTTSVVQEEAEHPSPTKSTFFDDEMSVREEMEAEPIVEDNENTILESVGFAAVDVDEMDLDLAQEADDLSILEPSGVEGFQTGLEFLQTESPREEQLEELELRETTELNQHQTQTDAIEQELGEQFAVADLGLLEAEVADPTTLEVEEAPEVALSEASQEYGDENDDFIDPELLALPLPTTPKNETPKRVLAERVFHTVCKIPLKAAADDTPMRPVTVKRSASISRLPIQRPSHGLSRSNTVISYSPSKKPSLTHEVKDVTMDDVPTTPAKSDMEMWSTIATPARTPRRDLDTSLLKGAVCFVDVHTSEGADASLIFTELLTQMGARCVKSWNWNGCSEDGSKIGITHVVFKDGGKRTLEKSRATDGVVSCVGVGWVLDCERENKWLSETPYLIDTAMVPRGGHRRRKSMEPKALANMNGTLLPFVTPVKNSRKTMSPTKASFTIAETPFTSKSHRRDSVQWVLSPANSSDTCEDQILTPVPATPAPEVISAYAEEGIYGDETPGSHTPYYNQKEHLVQKTAPPGKRYFDGEGGNGGFLSEKKDESVMMRLMAARRKSLQFAPKIGSPLARAAEW